MLETPPCAVCAGTDWQVLKRTTYTPAAHLAQATPYDRARYRVLFDVWFGGATSVTLSSVGCKRCGFVCYMPRPERSDIDRKYQALAVDPDSSPEFGRDLATDRLRSRELFRFIRRHCGTSRKNLVDFGGGKGRLLHSFVEAGYSCGIVDYTAEAIPGTRYLGRDIAGVATGSADIVICSHVVEHLADPRETLRELSRLLAPDGELYVEVPLEIWNSCPPKIDPVTHVNFFTRESLAALLQGAGLVVRQCRYDTFVRPNGMQGFAVKALARNPVAGETVRPEYKGLAPVHALLAPSLPRRVGRILRHPSLLLNLLA